MPEKQQKGTKEEGTIYISSTGGYYEAPEIDADKLRDFKDNIYVRGLLTKYKNLIFSDKFTLEVKDPKGETDEDLQKSMTQMCEQKHVRLWSKMQVGCIDGVFMYGIGLYNDVWGYEDNEYKLLKLRYLPAYTFRTAPITGTTKIYSQILQGITLNEDKNKIEFYQTDENGITQQLKNVFYIKDPAAQGLTGESIIVPLVPIIEMLKYAWDMQMKQVHRTGAKILFIKVDNPQLASNKNGNVGDVEYANKLLEKWSSDMAYQLRGNMTLIDPGIKDDSNNLEIIDALHHMLIDYVTPTSFIAREGSSIGGSEKQREEMLFKYIAGIHSWIEDQFEMLLNRYLEYNEYKDYTVSIHIPTPSIDRSEVHLKQVDMGIKGKALFPNEIRKRLEADALDEEDLKKLEDYYSRVTPPPSGMGGMSMGGMSMSMAELEQQQPSTEGLIRAAKAILTLNPRFFENVEGKAIKNAAEEIIKKETPKKVEKSMEKELKEASDKLSNSVIKALENEGK